MPFYELLNLLKLSQTQDVKSYLFDNIEITSKTVGKVEKKIISIKNPDFHKVPTEEELSSLLLNRIGEKETSNGFLFSFKKDKHFEGKKYGVIVKYPLICVYDPESY